jgi:hypothetical protein
MSTAGGGVVSLMELGLGLDSGDQALAESSSDRPRGFSLQGLLSPTWGRYQGQGLAWTRGQ